MKKYIIGMIVSVAVLGFITAGWAEESAEVIAEESAETSAAGKHGIRIALRNAPGISEVEEDDGGAITTYSTDSEDGVQIDVMYAKRFMGADGNNTVGGFVGGGLFFANSSGELLGGAAEAELTAFGVIGEGGVAVQLGRIVVLEAGGFLGLGASDQEITMGPLTESATGGYAQFGVKGGIYFQIARHIELGLEAGYVGFASLAQFDDPLGTGDTYDITFTGDGFQGGGVFVVKF